MGTRITSEGSSVLVAEEPDEVRELLENGKHFVELTGINGKVHVATRKVTSLSPAVMVAPVSLDG
jgi:hypothetical protein